MNVDSISHLIEGPVAMAAVARGKPPPTPIVWGLAHAWWRFRQAQAQLLMTDRRWPYPTIDERTVRRVLLVAHQRHPLMFVLNPEVIPDLSIGEISVVEAAEEIARVVNEIGLQGAPPSSHH